MRASPNSCAPGATSLAKSGLRCDQITLRMTRAEIGNYLGMTLETVSRALSKLARREVIAFSEKGRRDIRIPSVGAVGLHPGLSRAGLSDPAIDAWRSFTFAHDPAIA
jgi:hypothetical protein